MSDALKREAAQAVAAQWGLQTVEGGVEAALEHVRRELAARIAQLLLQDFPRLANAFYRLDVNEAKVKAILTDKDGAPEQIPYRLADLVIERELQKAQTRQRYS